MSKNRRLRHAYTNLVACIEESDIPPIENTWLENILSKIPSCLRVGKESELNQVLEEVKSNFQSTIQKNVLGQIIKAPPIMGLENRNFDLVLLKTR